MLIIIIGNCHSHFFFHFSFWIILNSHLLKFLFFFISYLYINNFIIMHQTSYNLFPICKRYHHHLHSLHEQPFRSPLSNISSTSLNFEIVFFFFLDIYFELCQWQRGLNCGIQYYYYSCCSSSCQFGFMVQHKYPVTSFLEVHYTTMAITISFELQPGLITCPMGLTFRQGLREDFRMGETWEIFQVFSSYFNEHFTVSSTRFLYFLKFKQNKFINI